MKILIAGIGGIGGVLAARLIQAGTRPADRMIKEIEGGQRPIQPANMEELLSVLSG